jgi:predicted Zn-dependent protease
MMATTGGSVPIQQLVEQALACSGADGCLVIGEERTEANLRWAGNSLTTNGQMHSRKLTVISVFSREDLPRTGVVSRVVSTPEEVAALVSASEDAARTAAPADDAAPLIEPYRHSDDWDVPAALTSIEVFSDFAPALGLAFEQAESADRLLYGFAEHIVTSTFLASSTGLRRSYDQPTGRLELNAKSRDLSRSAWSGTHTRNFADVDLPALTADLAKRLDWAATRIELPAGRYETLLPPSAMADLMVYLYWTAAARDAEEGRNVFAAGGGRTKIGQQLSPLPLTLRSNPDEPGLQCAPFQVSVEGGEESVFDNGAPAAATSWITDGVLTNLQRTRNRAERTSQPYVGNIDNLILEGPASQEAKSLDELIASTERGLLVTCLWYLRAVDPEKLLLTGSTRDGVYLIENGEVRGAVNNFRFNESPVDLLDRITEVGRTEPALPREWSDFFTRTAMPTVRVPDFNMSTVSQAS